MNIPSARSISVLILNSDQYIIYFPLLATGDKPVPVYVVSDVIKRKLEISIVSGVNEHKEAYMCTEHKGRI